MWGIFCIAFFVLAGCGQPKGVIFEAVKPPLFWPQPPDTPRIRFVGSITTDADLKPAKSFGRALNEAIFGKHDIHSMLSPFALCTDGRDRLFVADSNAQVVHVFNLNTREYQQWKPAGQKSEARDQKPTISSASDSTPPPHRIAISPAQPAAALHSLILSPSQANAFSQPVGVAYDPRGYLFVSDSIAGVIFVFNDTGELLGNFARDYVARPCGIAIDSARGRFFVADTASHQVIVLQDNGELITRIGGRGTQLGQFNYPTNVAVDSLGRLYVSDSLNFRVQIFDENLKPLRQIGRQGDMPGYFARPKGVAIDSENHVYVVDAAFEAVQIFDPGGAVLMSFGEEGNKPGQFWLPAGIFIDADDRIWIADTYNRRVQVFEYRPEAKP